jgi:hypothetical protein
MRANKQEKSFAIRITPRKFDTIKNVLRGVFWGQEELLDVTLGVKKTLDGVL